MSFKSRIPVREGAWTSRHSEPSLAGIEAKLAQLEEWQGLHILHLLVATGGSAEEP